MITTNNTSKKAGRMIIILRILSDIDIIFLSRADAAYSGAFPFLCTQFKFKVYSNQTGFSVLDSSCEIFGTNEL